MNQKQAKRIRKKVAEAVAGKPELQAKFKTLYRRAKKIYTANRTWAS